MLQHYLNELIASSAKVKCKVLANTKNGNLFFENEITLSVYEQLLISLEADRFIRSARFQTCVVFVVDLHFLCA